MAKLNIDQLQLKRIDEADVASSTYVLEAREPILIRKADNSLILKVGDGVNLIKDLPIVNATAMGEYAPLVDFNAHKNNTSNPHSVTKAQVGLGNVDNTSDANKPISTATQTELDKKIELLGNEVGSGQPYHFPYHLEPNINGNDFKFKAYTITLDNNKTLTNYDFSLPLATNTSAGLMSKEDYYTLHNLGSVYQLVSNLETSIPTTPTDDKYLSTKAVKTALNDKISLLGNEAVSGLPYNFPYHFVFTQGEDGIEVKLYTITLDNNKSLNTFTSTLPSATSLKAGLMSKADKVKLDGFDSTLFQLKSNLVSAFQTTPDDTHYISEKLAKDNFDAKQDKLPTYIEDYYLRVFKDTDNVLKLKWETPTVTAGSHKGQIIIDAELDTMLKVQTLFNDPKDTGGHFTTYWVLLNHDTNYYEWQRTDSVPMYALCDGQIIVSTTIISKDTLLDGDYEANDFNLLGNSDGSWQWTVTDVFGISQRQIPAYVGLVVQNTKKSTVAEIQAVYGGTWEQWDDGAISGLYQYHCLTHDAPTSTIPSKVGDTIFNTNCANASDVIALYGGTGWILLDSFNDGTTTIYQWHRNA